MPSIPSDLNRRLWLTTTTVTGGAGLIASAIPFVASLAPTDLSVPPYRFDSGFVLLIDSDT